MNAHFDFSGLQKFASELDAVCGGDEALFHDMLVGETNVDHVVSRIHEQIARDQEMLIGIGVRMEALKERKQRIEARANAGKTFIGKVMRAASLSRLELPEVTYSIRDGKPSLKVVDPLAVPLELCRQKAEPDKAKINETYADAKALPNWLVREPARDVISARTK